MESAIRLASGETSDRRAPAPAKQRPLGVAREESTHGPRSRRGARRACAFLLAGVVLPLAASAQPVVLATRPGDGDVAAIDTSGGGVVATIAVGGMPAGATVSPDETRLYVADANGGALHVIDLGGGPAASVSVGLGPAGVAYCAATGRVAVALAQQDAVAVVDASSLTLVGTLPAGDQPLAVACDTGFLAVTNYAGSSLSVFDAVTLAPLGTATVGSFPAGVAIGGGRAWVTSLFDSTVTVVALPAATPTSTVAVGSAPRGIALAGNRVVVGNVNDATLTVLDALTAAVVTTVPLPTPGPTDLRLIGGNVHVAHLGEPAISVFDVNTLTVVNTLGAPTGLLALAGGAERGVESAEVPALGPLGLVVLAGILAALALRFRSLPALVLVVGLWGAVPLGAQSVTYTDDTFPLASWEVFSAEVGTGGQGVQQTPQDGNPAPSRAMQHFHDESAAIRVVHRWVAATHDPPTDGPINSLDVSWDRRAGGIDCEGNDVEESFVVFQGGIAFFGPSSLFSNESWENVALDDLTAIGFTDAGGNHPDFSATGGPLSFGYSRHSLATTVVCHGIDNLVVSAATAETPGVSLLAFSELDHFVVAGDALVVGVTRTGDVTQPASVQVLLAEPGGGGGTTRDVSWAAGVGGEATVAFTAAEVGGGDELQTRSLQLFGEQGAQLDPTGSRAMVYVANDELSLLWATLALVLARWELAGLLLLAGLATYAALRRRQQQARGSARERPVEVGVEGRRPAQVGTGRPDADALRRQLRGQDDQDHHAQPPVAVERRHATSGEEAVEKTRQAGHRRRVGREQQHAQRPAEGREDGNEAPPAGRELAAHRQCHHPQPGEVPDEVPRVGMHQVRGEQAPGLAGQYGATAVDERRHRGRPGEVEQHADDRQGEERRVATHDSAASSHASRTARWVMAAIPALVVSWGCVGTGDIVLHYKGARFNDRISADLNALSPDERAADLSYGVFRLGSEDPDGDGPRQGGLVSEIYPFGAISSQGVPGQLVQTPCLFVARNGGDGEELRFTWEVVGELDAAADENLKKIFGDRKAEIGLCTYSSPETRVLFEDPGVAYPTDSDFLAAASHCVGTNSSGAVALTLPKDLENGPRNIPWPCRIGGNLDVRLERLGHRDPNPDAQCPTGPFTSAPTPVDTFGCYRNGQLRPACALPCAVRAEEDTSYRVRTDSTELPAAERWLRPDVMVVDGQRTVTRRMEVVAPTPPATGYDVSWQVRTLPPSPGEGPVKWAENYSPSVRLESVQILSRDAQGTERVEAPVQGQLTIQVPQAGQPAPALLRCTGQDEPGVGFLFSVADCVDQNDAPTALTALTPTYLVANLWAAAPVKVPIIWRAALASVDPGRSVFIRFGLQVQTVPAAMRMSPLRNFGRIPDTDYRQGEIELENVGGETVDVTAVELVPTVGQPQDFSFFVVGDPVPVPLPVEARAQGDGSTLLRLADLRDVPGITLSDRGDRVEVRLGDPAVSPEQPQSLTLYGETATLRGALLTRDDPGARFEPPAGSRPRPLAVPAYLEEQPPFRMAPGERRRIAVEARPTAQGVRLAQLAVRYAPASDPRQVTEIRSVLQVEVLSGPLLQVIPTGVYVHGNDGRPTHRNAVAWNAGHFDLTVTSVHVTGAQAGRFVLTTGPGGSGPFLLRPGESLDLRVTYLPECDGSYGTATSILDHQATLVLTSDGGTARVPLGGSSQWFCAP
jgi:YVTN family beta-propeller protein